ncbi:MAG TPA: molybdopterin oxidoreductase [Cellulomonas sp.]|nr:molybdopterin oxidoreductase [Cellulomonas sp.]
MAVRREVRHHRPVEWWVVGAFISVGLIVVAGLAAATGMY